MLAWLCVSSVAKECGSTRRGGEYFFHTLSIPNNFCKWKFLVRWNLGLPNRGRETGWAGWSFASFQQKFVVSTLTYLIIVQDVINVQAGKFPGINKRAGCNKAVQVGIFQESIVKKTCRLEKFQKLINVQDVIRPCRLDFFKKIIKRAACLFDTLE